MLIIFEGKGGTLESKGVYLSYPTDNSGTK